MTEWTSHHPGFALASVAALAIVFAAAGCGSSDKSGGKPPESPPTERIVTIQLKTGPDGGVTGYKEPVSDDPVSNGMEAAVGKQKGEVIHWIVSPASANVTLTIALKPGETDPFETEITNFGKHSRSGKVKKDADVTSPKYKHEYLVTVHDNASNKDLPSDPIIRVDP
jgi:hypothetical protein